jgi:type IV pilus assembly protein PilO
MKTSVPSNWQEPLRSPLTWHGVAIAVLAVVVAVLGVRLVLDWSVTSDNSASELASKRTQLKALELQTAPLRGLDQKVADTRTQIESFYAKRIPANYSSIAAHVGTLEVASGVRLTRMLYTQGAPQGNLSEISLDAGVSGTYPEIMRFINGLERDPNFFVIRAMSLTGQQGGLVNLRLKVSTWLRAADAAQSGLPLTKDDSGSATPNEGEGQ